MAPHKSNTNKHKSRAKSEEELGTEGGWGGGSVILSPENLLNFEL